MSRCAQWERPWEPIVHKHVLVTGGAGFVGSSLALALRREEPSLSVTALDNLRRRGSELNLGRLRAAGVPFIHGDIRSLEDLANLPHAPDLILECSAEPSVLAGYGGSPEYLIRTNLLGCFHCLELARRAKADVLFVSTSRIYPVALLNRLALREEETRFTLSPDQDLPGVSAEGISEEFPLDGPRSLYGMTKLAGELLVEEYADAYGLRFIIDRCGLLTGPWQMGKSDQGVMVLWLAAHYFGRELRYIGYGGTGKQVRDFLHIEDFCDLVLDQIRHFDRYQGQRYNVGGGTACSLSLREATGLCQEVTGRSIAIGADPQNRPADVPLYISDHRKVSGTNGWRPRRDARATFRDIQDWLRAEEANVKGVLLGE
jgi:CDP-paratose 2-epimerase